MLDVKDFSFFEKENNFDFKGFLIKTISYWKWFVVSIIICLSVAYQINIRKQKIYSLQTVLTVTEQENPLFTSNTSLVFNWGGTSDQVQTIGETFSSRSHNELVVEKLSFYIDYLKERDYYTEDVYGKTPFIINIDKSKNQLLNHQIKIKFVSSTEFEISTDFESNSVKVINYSTNEIDKADVVIGSFKNKFKIGQKINLPFLNCYFSLVIKKDNYVGNEYIIKMNSFDETVSKYRDIKVSFDEKAGSLIKLSLEGNNKNRIVDYLNATVKMLMKNQLESKNLFAENTIKYIDTTLSLMESDLKKANNDLKDFSRNKNVFEIENGGSEFQKQIFDLDLKKEELERKLNYYTSLNNYLRNSNDFSKLPAPTIAGIDDINIIENVSKLIQLSINRSEIGYSTKSSVHFEKVDSEMSSVKKVLLENINSAKAAILFDSSLIKNKISQTENKISQLPDDNQEYLSIMRKYNLSNSIIDAYLQKRNEAQIVKAANLSDIQFIDPAKDIGEGLIGPKTSINYILAIFIGILIPLLIVIVLFFINNSIQNTDDINNLTQVPLIGVVGIKQGKSNLAVFEKPKSALSESFRAIRSSLQFLYKKQNVSGTKTLMITSSVSGEGKTFCSINIATVFAMSEKRTVVVGLDLRKPKIFDDFNIKNDIGIVNYLIGQKSLEDITQKTNIPNLDVITSGPIPPNPSELIMGENMNHFFEELRQKYDYIIIDSPPVGLVTDAVELSQYVDVTLYIIRQNYTKKEMIHMLNNRVKREELKNVSIIFNGYENKAKYGSNYNYGYGYGYGNYSNGYHEEELKSNVFGNFFRKLFNKNKS